LRRLFALTKSEKRLEEALNYLAQALTNTAGAATFGEINHVRYPSTPQ
jgi:hypothetical protein